MKRHGFVFLVCAIILFIVSFTAAAVLGPRLGILSTSASARAAIFIATYCMLFVLAWDVVLFILLTPEMKFLYSTRAFIFFACNGFLAASWAVFIHAKWASEEGATVDAQMSAGEMGISSALVIIVQVIGYVLLAAFPMVKSIIQDIKAAQPTGMTKSETSKSST